MLNQTQMKTLFWIYRSRVDKMGKSPIMLRLIIANESKNISTGVKINSHTWDAQKQRIKGNDLQVDQLKDLKKISFLLNCNINIKYFYMN